MSFPNRRAFIVCSIGLCYLFCGEPLLLSQDRCRNSDNYPVVVYDALTRTAQLTMKAAVDAMTGVPPPPPFSRFALAGLPHATFLCDGRPVEVYIVNRRLKTSFTVAVTNTFAPPAPTLDIRGVPPATTPAATTPPSPPPATKGLTSNAANNSTLLTTDQVIAFFLNDETFDRAYQRVTDDASDVSAQAIQFRSNVDTYLYAIHQFIGDAADCRPTLPSARASLRGVTTCWAQLQLAVVNGAAAAGAVDPAPITEFAFDDWTNRADRLETEVQRISSRVLGFPVADTVTNLQASAATLRDNFSDVLTERDAITRAIQLLRGIPLQHSIKSGPALEYWRQREIAEIRQYLRQHYTGPTITDAVLAQIVDAFLRGRLGELRSLRDLPDCITNPAGPAPLPAPAGSDVQSRYCEALTRLQTQANPNVIAAGLDESTIALAQVREEARNLNAAEAEAMHEINTVYDSYYAPVVLPLTLNLQASGNLFVYYTINGAEQFNRYQISSDFPILQSNCALTISLNNNVGAGANGCTTAASPAPTNPQASYAAAPFPNPPPAANAAAANAPNSSTSITAYTNFSGRLEVHHFSDGTLVTGVAFDSVTQPSFSWTACPTDASQPTGNFPTSASPTCISPTTAMNSTTPSTYYRLISSKQAPIAAVQGVDIFFRHQDQFPARRLDRSFGAFLGIAVYPLNHYFLGLSGEPWKRGFNLAGGVVVGSMNAIPPTFGHKVGDYLTSNPAIPSDTRFRPGFFIMAGFDTRLFGAIFDLSVFQNTGVAKVVGTPTAAASTTQ